MDKISNIKIVHISFFFTCLMTNLNQDLLNWGLGFTFIAVVQFIEINTQKVDALS